MTADIPLKFIDTHAHLDAFDEEGDLVGMLRRAAEAQVVRIVAIGGMPSTNDRAIRLAHSHPDRLRATVGLDRDEAGKPLDWKPLREQAGDPLCVAVGECGLDYHYRPETRPQQLELFEAMLALAAEVRKPIVVHSREAEADTLSLLRAHLSRPGVDAARPGVLHCFTGTAEFAGRLAEWGYFISFSGIITFRNAESLRAIARALPMERILAETDSPYLSPEPFRGRRNEPARLPWVVAALARARGIQVDNVGAQIWQNASDLFAWKE